MARRRRIKPSKRSRAHSDSVDYESFRFEVQENPDWLVGGD